MVMVDAWMVLELETERQLWGRGWITKGFANEQCSQFGV